MWVDNGVLFQSTHPRGVRRPFLQHAVEIFVVSIHAPAGGATAQAFCDYQNQRVSIHAPAGGATIDDMGRSRWSAVSIHAPAGGATLGHLRVHCQYVCFNPRTRGGCDEARSAEYTKIQVFQSTHPRGVRREDNLAGLTCNLFQSTHPRGVRLARRSKDAYYFRVSIHAPAGGATFILAASPATTIEFQSTHPRGVRRNVCRLYPPVRMFQSTHPRGVRLQQGQDQILSYMFQSTHPRGVRLGPFVRSLSSTVVSIHAPAGGATEIGTGFIAIFVVSIHAPAGGATTYHRPTEFHSRPFQSTHPRGVRPAPKGCCQTEFVFQSTHPRGVRHDGYLFSNGSYQVSIHAPAGGATSPFPCSSRLL